jgi:hypothetical protein
VSIILLSVAAGGGFILARWIAGRAREREVTEGPAGNASVQAPGAHSSVSSSSPAVPPEASRSPRPHVARVPDARADPLAEFPCHLGDVVMGMGGDEAWLAGALVFFESAPAAALFVAPEAGGDRALYVRPKPAPSIVWLMPIAAGELTIGAEPPSSLEHKGERFERVRRVPFRVERLGTGAPDVGEQAIVGEYASGGERMIVVAGGGTTRAWRGRALEDGTYDVLPSGKSTLQ